MLRPGLRVDVRVLVQLDLLVLADAERGELLLGGALHGGRQLQELGLGLELLQADRPALVVVHPHELLERVEVRLHPLEKHFELLAVDRPAFVRVEAVEHLFDCFRNFAHVYFFNIIKSVHEPLDELNFVYDS